jgi:hypothetical protein
VLVPGMVALAQDNNQDQLPAGCHQKLKHTPKLAHSSHLRGRAAATEHSSVFSHRVPNLNHGDANRSERNDCSPFFSEVFQLQPVDVPWKAAGGMGRPCATPADCWEKLRLHALPSSTWNSNRRLLHVCLAGMDEWLFFETFGSMWIKWGMNTMFVVNFWGRMSERVWLICHTVHLETSTFLALKKLAFSRCFKGMACLFTYTLQR